MISHDGKELSVECNVRRFKAELIEFDGDRLLFKLQGGDSGWSFIYKLYSPNLNATHLKVSVLREHDQRNFHGNFSTKRYTRDKLSKTMILENCCCH